MTIGGRQIIIDALFSMNRMEQYLEFADSCDDYKTALAKFAYTICKESSDDEVPLDESDFIKLPESELAKFATVLYKQATDSEKEPGVYIGDDIFGVLYEKSNGLRIQIAETARKFITPFLKTQKHISKMQQTFDAVSKFDNMIPKFGADNISKALGIAKNINFQNSAFYNAAHDAGTISSAMVQVFDANYMVNRLALPHINVLNENILFGLQEIAAISNKLNQFVNTMISPSVVGALQLTASRIEEITNPLGNVIASISENFFNPLRELWDTIDFDEMHRSLLEKERKGIEQLLFEAKWFMFSADIAVGSFVLDVVDVLQNKRVKNYEKHIDAIVFKYVTQDEVDDIGREWKTRKLSKHLKRILLEAIGAYKKRQYATTAIVLSNLWQGFIFDLCDKSDERVDKKTKEYFAQIISKENAPEIILQFHDTYIWGNCYDRTQVIDGIPGRHAIAHGWLMKTKYPSRKEALNAILFTHFLISCYDYENDISI